MSKQKKKGSMPELRFPEFRDKGEWIQAKIGDIAISESSTLSLNKLSFRAEGNPVYGADSCVGFIDSFAQNEDYIAIVKDGSGVGRLSLKPGRSSVLSTLAYLKCKPNSGTILPWLYYCLNSLDFRKYVKGSGIPHIYFSDYATHDILVPSPLEQKKIAGCLTSVDELITARTQKLNTLKTHKKGLMQQLFPAEGETVPKIRFPEFQDKGEWIKSTIGDISEIASGGTPSRSIPEYWNGDIPWVSTTLIDFNTIERVNEYITQDGLNNSSTKVFPKGTILMAMYGQGTTRGKVAMLGINAAVNQACAAISLNEKVNTEFFFQNLSARYDEIRKISNPGGQENLSAGLIKQISFLHPEIESREQQKIADCLASIDELITAQTQRLDVLKAHKEGLMQRLFPALDEVES